MAISTVDRELQEYLSNFGQGQKQRLLEYARTIASETPRGVPGPSLDRFWGRISEDDAREMLKVIEEECEQIDPDGW